MGWRNRTIRKCSVSINPSLASNHTSVLRAVQLTFRPAVILAVDVPVGVSHAVPINLFVEIAFFFAFAFFAFSLAVAIAFRTGMIADGQERMHSVSATGPQRNGPGQPGPDRLNRKPQSACSRMPARQQKKRGWGDDVIGRRLYLLNTRHSLLDGNTPKTCPQVPATRHTHTLAHT